MQHHDQSLVDSGAVAMVCILTGCAGQQHQVAREQHDYEAECRRFGAAVDSPTYINCRVALRALEQSEQAAPAPLHASSRQGNGDLQFDRDSHKEMQWEAESKRESKESGCARIRVGQLIVPECGLGIPLADLLAGLDV